MPCNAIVVVIFLKRSSCADNFSRPFKKSGAWMSDYRSQSRNNQEKLMVTPIVVNNNNFAKVQVTVFHERLLLSYYWIM